MSSYKTTILVLFIAVFLANSHSAIAAETGPANRYLVKSDKPFWQRSFGVRNVFADGFTANLSDLQVRLAKFFGVEVVPVKIFHILPDSMVPSSDPVQVAQKASTNTTLHRASLRSLPSGQISWGVRALYDDPTLIKTSGGGDVGVAVLDTGVYTDHVDLKDRIIECKDFTDISVSVIDNKCIDHNGHGTHVAGIVAADAGSDGKGIYGVAPEADILAYKVCDDDGSCYADDIAVGIRTAVDEGAKIINMSFGSDVDSSLVHDAIDYATSNGVLSVAAAGNDGPFPDSIDYPSAYASVVAVGALDKDSNVVDWSSRGLNDSKKADITKDRTIDFTAPGVNIESTSRTGGYVSLSGTSMASPFIAGLAAKMWQYNDTDPAGATRLLLQKSAMDIGPSGNDDASGFGLPRAPSR